MVVKSRFEETLKHEELPLLYHINSMDVYNLLQDIGTNKLIIDLRNKETYEKGHIRAAINIPPPTKTNEDTLKEFNLSKYISSNVTAKHWNLLFQKIIVYSDKPFLYNIDELEKTIETTSSPSTSTTSSPSSTSTTSLSNSGEQDIIKPLIISNWDKVLLRHFLIKKKKTKVIIYQGGFEQFQKQYPFMCIDSISSSGVSGTSGSGGSKIIVGASQLYPSEIIEDFLYLGGVENASSRIQLNNLKITHIVNMASELDDVYPHSFKYYRANLDDRPKANIYEHFEPIIEFINDAKKKGGRVLVHCAMGISRSTTVVIAWLMSQESMTYDEAFTFCKQKRSIVNPNFGFVKQLKEYQHKLDIEKLKKQQQQQLIIFKKDLSDPLLNNIGPPSPLISSTLPIAVEKTSPPIILGYVDNTPPTLTTNSKLPTIPNKQEETTIKETTNNEIKENNCLSDSIFNFVDKQEEKMLHPTINNNNNNNNTTTTSNIIIPQSSL